MFESRKDRWDACDEWESTASDVIRDILDEVEEHCGAGGTAVVCVVRRTTIEADRPEAPGPRRDPSVSENLQEAGGEAAPPSEATSDEMPMDAFDIHNPAQLGRLGEELAARYMESSGYVIEERNYRTPHGEADIVCRSGEETVLVEVKTRLGTQARPEEAVTDEKIRRYRNITLDYLAKTDPAANVRFDVIALNVVGAHAARVHHFVGVCSWEG